MSIARGKKAASLLALVVIAVQMQPVKGDGGQEVRGKEGQVPSQRKVELVVQMGHSTGVEWAAFSPDGKYVLSTSLNTALLWEVETGREVRQFTETSHITSGAFSPDGKYVLTVSEDKTVRLWEVETGNEVRQFKETSDITSVAHSPDGRYALTGNRDGSVRLWKVETEQEVRRFLGPYVVDSVAFSPDGEYVLSRSANTARLWEVETGREVRQLESGKDTKILALSPDGKYVLTGSTDGSVRLREVETGREIRQFSGHSSWPDSGAFSLDGKYILTESWDVTVQLWEVETGREIRQLEFGEDTKILALSPDGKYLLTGSRGGLVISFDGTARLWEFETGREVRQFRMNSSVVAKVAFSTDGKYILTGADAARLWDVETGRQERQSQLNLLEQFLDPSDAFSPDGKYVLTLDDGSVRLWEVETGQEVRRLSETVESVTFSPDGKYVLTESKDGSARLWDVETGREVRQFQWGEGESFLTFSHDVKYVLTTSRDGSVRLREVETGREMRQFRGHSKWVDSGAFSSDGKYVLTRSDGSVRQWEVETGQEIRRFSVEEYVESDAFSRDGKYVLTASEKAVRLWDVGTGREVRQFQVHGNFISVAFSPDGRYVLTGGLDATRLWDLSSGKELCRLISFRDGNWAVVDPEGRFDTSNLEEIEGLNWRMPDDPLHLLPVEIFMRDYYEPRLLSRILSGETFKPVGNISQRNRTQPKVEITAIKRQQGSPDQVSVTVTVARTSSGIQKDRAGKPLTTDMCDLRLFRDGQIVAQEPVPFTLAAASTTLTGPQQLIADILRKVLATAATEPRLNLNSDGSATITFKDIKLPRKANLKQVEFTAYAFNDDRIKSQTARKTFNLPPDLLPVKGNAYIVAVGVNLFDEPTFNLSYSVNDARSILQMLGKKLVAQGDYKQVVQVPLISDCQLQPGDVPATKANFKAVVDLLAGRKPDPKALKAIPSELVARLREAQPQDLVLISFSTHGYADSNGNFYCVLSDTGKVDEKEITERLLKRLTPRFVSSEELSVWLRDVDAGEMIMIVDACHSAALAGQEFKPGPMGSRGLGQLSYDKGMRILTATQADNVALGSGVLRQGLLTYALVRDGIEKGEADYDPRDRQVTAQEWLRFGERRVPRLYEQIRKGEMRDLVTLQKAREGSRCVVEKPFNIKELTQGKIKMQQPSLFDFTKAKRDTLLFILGKK